MTIPSQTYFIDPESMLYAGQINRYIYTLRLLHVTIERCGQVAEGYLHDRVMSENNQIGISICLLRCGMIFEPIWWILAFFFRYSVSALRLRLIEGTLRA